MTILFAGGEDADFTRTGGGTVDTATTAVRRTAYSRCSLKLNSNSLTDGFIGQFSAASSAFWITAREGTTADTFTGGSAGNVIGLYDGLVLRLALVCYQFTGSNLSGLAYRLVKINAAGSSTTLVTTTNQFATATTTKIDMHVTYGTSGSVQVYLDGTQIINYSGDTTTDSATTLSGFGLFQPAANANTAVYWSEAIVATIDTRTLSLFTLPPAAAGNANTWTTGTYASVNETTLDDSTVATSASVNQIFETTVTTTGLTGAVVAVVVNARAQKGNTGGPANANLMVRTASTDYLSSSVALPTGALDKISAVWETNPNTSAAWATSDITAAGFNIGIKSLT